MRTVCYSCAGQTSSMLSDVSIEKAINVSWKMEAQLIVTNASSTWLGNDSLFHFSLFLIFSFAYSFYGVTAKSFCVLKFCDCDCYSIHYTCWELHCVLFLQTMFQGLTSTVSASGIPFYRLYSRVEGEGIAATHCRSPHNSGESQGCDWYNAE